MLKRSAARRAILMSAGATLVTLGATGALALVQGKAADTAVYWMTADTNSGLGAMRGAGASAMLGAMRGGAPAYSQDLQLQLGTGRAAAGEPSAEHLPPAALRAGASLPLLTPKSVSAPAQSGGMPAGMERPKGRMLIYWGCGDRARAGQPVVIDFASVAAGKMPPAFAALNLKAANPPQAGWAGTYGEWPNTRSGTRVPAGASLVGDHLVRGNYTPDIRFNLAAGQDFLAPVTLAAQQSAPSGAMPVSWRPVSGAKAWFASTMGAAESGDFIMWSSSETQVMPYLMSHLAPEDIARLLGRKVLLPASASACTVPAEVAKAAPQSMLSVTAFGGEVNLSHPARPAKAAAGWRPDWTVKLRTKSTHMSMLGMDMAQMMGDTDAEGEDKGEIVQRQAPRKKRSLLERGIGRILGQ
jgi:hypothetical protein